MANAINLPLPIPSNYLQVNANSLLGNPTGSPATGSNILLGSTLVFNTGALQTSALTGDVTTSANSFATTLATVNSNVGSFGSATQVGTFTVNAKGLITAAGNVTISGVAPGGAAGGDLSGTYPNPTVAKINGVLLGSTTATAGNVLLGDGTQWVSTAMSGDATLTSLGVLTIANNAITTAKINNNAVTFAKFQQVNANSFVGNPTGATANATNITLGSTLVFNTGALQTTALSGDVTTSANSFATTLATVNSNVGSFGSATQVGTFTVNAKGLITAAANVTISGVAPGGAAGGDLSGTYPNPTVAKINGVLLGSTTATAGNLLIGDGTQWVSTAMSGDATLSSLGVLTIANNAITTPKINNNAVTFAKFQQVNANSLVGNPTGSTADATNITLGSTLVFNTGALQTSALTGDVTTSANSFATTLATVNSNVGSFGSATQVGTFTVNAKGLITAAANVTISGVAPGGAAGGDLSGTYPNPTVAKINGVLLGSTTATAGNVLLGDGTQWVSTAMSGDATLTSLGVLTIANNAITTPKINNNAVTFAKFQQVNANSFVGNPTGATADATNITLGSTLVFNTGALQTSALTGDVTTSANSFATTLATVNSNVGSFGSATQVGTFTVNAKGLITAASNVTISGVAPGGAAGGDLSGTYPNPTVAKINGVLLGSTTATAGNLLIGDGTQWVSTAMSGDATLSSLGVLTIANNAITTPKINNNAVTFAKFQQVNANSLVGNPTGATANATNITLGSTLVFNTGALQTTALTGDVTTSANSFATTLATVNSNVGSFGSATQVGTFTVNAKGLITAAGNVTISGVAPGGAAGGDLSGTYPNPTVAKINGVTLGSTTATSGNLLIGSGTQWVSTAMSGDASLSSLGVLTIANNAITTVKINNGAVDLTTKVSGILPISNGGTNISTYTLGDTLFASATNTLSKLAGNITTTKQYLSQTGTGAISAAPTWSTISGSDITGAALTSVNDTNVTLTLGGTPATALLRASSITAGWTGQLSAARGGTGIGSYNVGDLLYASGATTLSTLADVAIGNALISGGVGLAPTWGQISLTSAVFNILPVINGGTGLNAGISGGIPFFSSTTSMASSAALTANGIVLGGGPSIAPQANSDFTYSSGLAQINTTSLNARWTLQTTNVADGNEASVFLYRANQAAGGYAQIHFLTLNPSLVEDWAIGTRKGSNSFSFFTGGTTVVASLSTAGVLNLTSLTASQLVLTDASKNLVSAAVLSPTLGGTGVNNGSSTITLSGNFTTAGGNDLTLTTAGATNVTLPTTGTLATTNQVITWTATPTSITLSASTGTITTGASLVTLTLPASPLVGTVFYVAGQGSGGWKIAQAANQIIHCGNVDTTLSTGSISSTNRYDCIALVCVVNGATIEFTTISMVGNLSCV